jgi:Rad3-related DNA helicase
MAENEILSRVDELVAEEHELRARATGQGLSADERTRLGELEVQLDQCWDLLRQRRARSEFGEDPEAAKARPAGEVEGYLQ